jgi:uncharacterized membrane protein YcaP (DUF421 family)
MWQRILLGEEPLTFLGEVLLRTLIMFLFLTFLMRSLGKRMGGQTSNLELGVMISLGAIVSLPMQVGESGIFPAAVLLICLLGLQRSLTALIERSARVERLTQGSPSILVRDGELCKEELKSARITERELFSLLRSRDVRQLGEIKRAYLESGGVISVLRARPVREGRSIVPTEEA